MRTSSRGKSSYKPCSGLSDHKWRSRLAGTSWMVMHAFPADRAANPSSTAATNTQAICCTDLFVGRRLDALKIARARQSRRTFATARRLWRR